MNNLELYISIVPNVPVVLDKTKLLTKLFSCLMIVLCKNKRSRGLEVENNANEESGFLKVVAVEGC